MVSLVTSLVGWHMLHFLKVPKGTYNAENLTPIIVCLGLRKADSPICSNINCALVGAARLNRLGIYQSYVWRVTLNNKRLANDQQRCKRVVAAERFSCPFHHLTHTTLMHPHLGL